MELDFTKYTQEELKDDVEYLINAAHEVDYRKWGHRYVGCLNIEFTNGEREDEFMAGGCLWYKVCQLDGGDYDVINYVTGEYLVNQDLEEDEFDKAFNAVKNDYYICFRDSFYDNKNYVIRLTDIKSIELDKYEVEEYE